MMQKCQMNHQQLMHYINLVSFAVVEANLFLDTHPNNREAREYFDYYNKERNEALEEYGRRFSPLTISTVPSCEEKWKWVYGPWPWEGGEC